MVVDDLDLPCFAIAPDETDTPLFVDANAVLPLAVAPQRLKSVAGRHSQIVELACGLNSQEFCSRPLLELYWQAANGMARKDGRATLVGETLDHEQA